MATAVETFEKKYPQVVERGINQAQWNTLKGSLYAGAKDDSILMVVDYCNARKLDPMLKPVHIVPMSVKDDKGAYNMKDVVMAGIGMYRIQAARSGDLAGTSSPIFGPDITAQLGAVSFTYPDWCEVTVTKLIGDRLVDFVSREYFTENYATKKRGDETPNAMWTKRPRGQLAKCAEAQALRKGWPEIGQEPTYEEMAGKTERDITPIKKSLASLMQPTPEEDMEWFDLLMESISSATKVAELGALYEMGVNECNAHKNQEALEHIATACRNKEQVLTG